MGVPMSGEYHSSPSSSIEKQKLTTLNETITFRVQPTTVSIFIDKLFMMLNDSTIKDWISWSDSGESFLVYDIYDFSQEVLPKYFKHSRWSSFIRQLNTYGFCKVADYKNSNDKQTSEFKHPLFNQNSQHILHKIRRNMKQSISDLSSSSSPSLSLSLTSSSSLKYGKLHDSSIRSIDNSMSVAKKHGNTNKENDLIAIKSLINSNTNLNHIADDDEEMSEVNTTDSSDKYSTICQKIDNLQMDADKLQTEIISLKNNVYNQQEIIEVILSSVMDKVDDDDDHTTKETTNEKANELLQSIKNFEQFGERLSLPNIQSKQKEHIIHTIYDHTTTLKPILNHKEIQNLKSNINYNTKIDDFNNKQTVSTSANSVTLTNLVNSTSPTEPNN